MSARIAIVGCGIIGATIAYELSRSGKYCIDVFDCQQPAQASTGAALGVLMGIISQKVKGRAWQLREESIRRYRELIPELERVTGLIPHTPHGLVKLLPADADLARWQQLAATRAQQQWQLELWATDRLAAKLPQLVGAASVAENRHSSQFAIYSPQDLQVNPIALTMALIAAARANGVNFHFDRPIAAFGANNPHSCELLADDLPKIDCDWAIVTAGLGSTGLLTPHAPIEIQPVLGQAMQIRSSQPLGDPQFQPVILVEDVNIVPCGGNEYWVGATVEFPLTKPLSMSIDKIPLAQTESLEQMQAIAFKACPALAQGEIVRTWTGLRPRPLARPAPVIDRVGENGRILVATGHYRNGILLAPATARLIGEMLP